MFDFLFFLDEYILLSTPQQQQPYQFNTQSQRGGGEGSTGGAQRENRCTSSQQRQQLGEVAPCADGLAWGFDEEGFGNEYTDHTPSKLGAGSSPVNVLREDRDTGKRVVPTPVPTAGRYVAYFATSSC